MFNPISFVNEVVITTATVNLGYGPGQQVPPLLLILNGTVAQTVNLPPVTSAPPPPPTQQIVGTGGGFRITLFNQGNQTITVNANGSDTITGTAAPAGANGKTTLQACPALGGWFVVA